MRRRRPLHLLHRNSGVIGFCVSFLIMIAGVGFLFLTTFFFFLFVRGFAGLVYI